MAKKSSDGFNKKPKLLATLPHKVTKDVLVSRPKKRIKVEETETRETHYSIASEKRFLDAAPARVHPRTALGVAKIDYFKQQQCYVTLKGLMVHQDVWHFKNAMDGKASMSGQPLMDFETVEWKLKKDLYVTTDQFASDVRILFCNAMVLHPVNHEIHGMAIKLSELFEMKWKSLQQKWAAKKEKDEEEKPKPKPKPKPKTNALENVTIKVSGSVAYKARKKRKSSVFEFGNEENKCPNSMREAPSNAKLLNKRAMSITTKTKQHPVDTTLAAQSSLFGCNDDGLQRKKEREAARVMVQGIERTVFVDDSLNSFQELELLCGHSLEDRNKLNPLKEILGLVLKDEFVTIVTDLDEENFLNRDWEEGEMVYFD